MNFSINSVVYFYDFICIALLVFNVLYILRSGSRSRQEMRRIRAWDAILDREMGSGGPSEKCLEYMERRLRRVRELTAFNTALEARVSAPCSDAQQTFIDGCYRAFQALALHYLHRPSMERAFFAYVISHYPPRDGGGQLPARLLEFLDNSTVYCRENVLQALYALGSAGGIEQALRMFNERGWYHHSRMLSDGLSGFRGDRAALAASLWADCREWEENFQIAVIQFASNVTDTMKEPFREALADQSTTVEVRFALIRYFTRHPDERVKPMLLEMVRQELDSGDTAIAACSALAHYPGQDTEKVLERALLSRNWYVRHNAAQSLLALGDEASAYAAAERVNDRYARQMLDYVTGKSVSGREAVSV